MGIQTAIWGEAKSRLLLTSLQFSLKYHLFYNTMHNGYSDSNLGRGKKPTCFYSFVTFIEI